MIPADPATERGRGADVFVVLAVGAGYSWWVATTHPFSTGSDVAVASGFAAMLLAVVLRARRRATPQKQNLRLAGVVPWAIVFALVVGLELFSLFAAPAHARSSYPTISSLYDAAASVEAVKALFVLGWLALGWALFLW